MGSSSPTPGSSQGAFWVATSDDVVLTRVVGLGTMNNSVPFQQLSEHLIGRGYRKFIFDLGECRGFDSTFLGILLGLAQAGRRVVLVNGNASHRALLEEVGMDQIVSLHEGRVGIPNLPMEKLEQRAVGSQERIRMVLTAHENLVRLDSRNEAKFGEFLARIRAELGEETT